jgi:PAS domain S-box-containing protein
MSCQEDESIAGVERPCVVSDELLSSGGAWRLLVENVTDYAIYLLDSQGRIATWNVGAERSKGYKQEEALGRNFSMFFLPEDIERGLPAQELAAAARDGRLEAQNWRLRKDGTKFWALVSLAAIRSPDGRLLGFAKITRDMTTQKAIEESQAQLALDLERCVTERTLQLECTVAELRIRNEEVETLVSMVSRDLSEKEVLLREVYHRVKNNMQVIQSLLKMGARASRSVDTRRDIETAVQRVHAMAMAHEHLYKMPDLANLTLSDYLRDVVEGAIGSNSERPERVQLQLDIDEIPIPLDFAIPLGLLANELVSNCLKHGLPHGCAGTISISTKIIPGAIRFEIHDDGPGLPEDFDATKCASMGVKLACSLAHQLGGRLEFSSNPGCRVQADLTRLCAQRDKPRPIAPPVQFPTAKKDGERKNGWTQDGKRRDRTSLFAGAVFRGGSPG